MLDLKGREIRTSLTKDSDGIEFKFGDKVMIRCDGMRIHSSNTCIQIDCAPALALLREGDEVKFGENSEVFGEISEGEPTQCTLVIKGGGLVKSNSPVKIPGSHYQKIPILRVED
jgi:pyruvate kinase